MPLAIEMREYGPPEVLRPVERAPRAPGPGEVAVRVAFAGVNRADCFIRSGEWPQAGGWPYVPGLELCGIVERVGEGVADVSPGDAVITMMQRLGGIHGTRPGGYQQLACVPAATLARVPAPLDLAAAAALGLPAVTADRALRVLAVGPGVRVLVHGGSGQVGAMAIQLARAAGADVVATGTRPDKFAFARACGASVVLDTRVAGWEDAARPIDAAFDLVGQATFPATLRAMAPGGRYVFVGATSGAALALDAWELMSPIALTGYSSERLTRDELRESMAALAAAVARGALRVPEPARYPLADAARAHADLEAGRVAGRMLLTCEPAPV
jgi:NADPH2:quinone reductase